MKKVIFIFIWLVLICSFLIARDTAKLKEQVQVLEKQLTGTSTDIPILIQLGQLCHKIVAMKKNSTFMEKGEKYFQKVLEYDPNNSVALIWYGSLMTLKGRDAWFPWQKLKHVETGCQYMDKAVRHDPENLAVRYIRARNNLSLPLFFHRIDTAIVDLQYIIDHIKADTTIQGVPSLDRVYLDLAEAYQNAGKLEKSLAIWKKVVETYPDTEPSKEAKNNLEKYGN
jgi:tetratricopeptide (TPR) repeat protein